MLPKISAHRTGSDEIKYMSISIKHDKLLGKYIEIWEKNSNSINSSNKILKQGFQCICQLVLLIDSVYRTGQNYYHQVFLEECKYAVEEKKIPENITDDIDISSYEESSHYSNEEKSNDLIF